MLKSNKEQYKYYHVNVMLPVNAPPLYVRVNKI